MLTWLQIIFDEGFQFWEYGVVHNKFSLIHCHSLQRPWNLHKPMELCHVLSCLVENLSQKLYLISCQVVRKEIMSCQLFLVVAIAVIGK